MAKKLYTSNTRALLFDIIYTLAISAVAATVYILGVSQNPAPSAYFGVFVLLAYIFFTVVGVAIRSELSRQRVKRGAKTELSNIGMQFFGKMHLQLAVINSIGEITITNDAFRESFLKNERRQKISIYDIFKFPAGENHILFDRDHADFFCEFGDQLFKVTPNSLGESGNSVLIFEDVTENRRLIRQYENTRTAISYIELDNISELTGGSVASRNKAALDAFDSCVRAWAEERGVVLCEHENYKYLAVMTEENLNSLMAEGFSSLLTPISEITDDSGVPLSFSLGSSVITEGDMSTRNTSALSAFEMAVNRGGATVAVKTDGDIEYFGGSVKTQPKRQKNRARYNAKQLQRLIKDADNVLIMGHASPDYDCIGAQMGIYCICRACGAEANIVNNPSTNYNITEALPIIDRMRGQEYRDAFITPDAALDKNSTGTLLICVDVSNTDKMENPDLFDNVPSTVIIDHHRKHSEFDKHIELEYIDASASSACELVGEMIELLDLPAGALSRDEATVMLSGIYLDTDNFRKSTGTRTFSAALFLRDKGANVDTVKKLFDISVAELEAESRISENFHMYGDIAIVCYDTHGESTDAKTRARVADSFVRAKEVEAAFVLCGEQSGPVSISARSAGNVNVELVMKKLGGGGSFDRAGGYVTASLDKCLELLCSAIDQTAQDAREQVGNLQ